MLTLLILTLATADNRSVDSTSTLDELVHSMDEVFQSADDLFQSWDDIHSMDEVRLSVDKFVRKCDKPIQTTNRAITLYEPSQPVNSALPMPHSGSSNAENPVPDADHEFNWARVFMSAWLGVVIVVTIFGLWAGIYMFLDILRNIIYDWMAIFVVLTVAAFCYWRGLYVYILQSSSEGMGLVVGMCFAYGYVMIVHHMESRPVASFKGTPIKLV